MTTHTPGPWYLREDRTEIRIYPDWNGRPGGVALTIGSTALSFRARRQGSHRGEQMVYLPFSEQDRADARLIAAAPDVFQALRILLNTSECPCIAGACDEHYSHEIARRAIAKVEGGK